MKFLTKILFFSTFLYALNAHALSILKHAEDDLRGNYSVTSYSDYFPFGYKTYAPNKSALDSVFKDALSDLSQSSKASFSYIYFENISDAVIHMKEGKTQIFLGAFYATNSFDDFDFVFPAALNNPIHLIMLPNKIGEVKSTEDLKNLKGIYLQTEIFSDHMLQVFHDYSFAPVSDADEAYKKLLTQEVDFIIGSYYYQYAQVLERGLKDYVAFSTRPLFNMPMFIALSKRTGNKIELQEYFRRLLANNTFKQKVLEHIKQRIKEKENACVGVVPPMYIKPQSTNDLTPADERLEETQQ